MQPLEQLRATLRQHRQSVTKQRQLVFSALQDEEPLTIQQLVQRCSGVDRASVYRIISLFEQLGIVQRLQVGWKYRLELSDVFHVHHHHATCLGCGQTIALPEHPELEKQLLDLAGRYHFQIQTHQLELQGYCQTCTEKRWRPL